MAERQRRYAFICGNNIDKGVIGRVESLIARDKDIRRLIGRGRFGYLRRAMIVLIVLFLAGLGLENFASEVLASPIASLSAVGLFLLAISAVQTFYDIRKATQDSLPFISYLTYAFGRKVPRYPSEMWHFIPGSVADAQMVLMARKVLDEDLYAFYAGVPYFQISYVDAICLRWTDGRRFEHRRLYNKMQMLYSMRSVTAYADDELFKNKNKRIEASNAVFGMLFLSEYLLREFENQNLIGGKKLIRVGIDIPAADSDNKTREKVKVAREFMQLCTSPDVVEIVDGSDDCSLVITDISMLTDEALSPISVHGGDIRIPVKRFLALPSDDDLLPDKWFPDECKVVFLGGAEQNLALQAMVNALKWSDGKLSENPPSPDSGSRFSRSDSTGSSLLLDFAENSFVSERNHALRVGTEGLVYGIKDILRSRNMNAETINEAELIHMRYGDHDVYSVFGYSAVMTEMSIGRFVQAQRESETDGERGSKWIPGQRSSSNETLHYRVEYDTSDKFIKSEAVRLWDESNANNDVEELKAWLNAVEENIEAE